MDYINLGKSGLKVSRLCLGCMSYGVPGRGTTHSAAPAPIFHSIASQLRLNP